VPLDRQAIVDSVRKTGRCIVVSEGHARGGFAAEVSAFVAETCMESLLAPVRRVTAADVPLPMSPALEPLVLPQTAWIVEAAREIVGHPSQKQGSPV
jgi:pyruvate/2-oxoglutarate/acetoin dehydrogenase E1 component